MQVLDLRPFWIRKATACWSSPAAGWVSRAVWFTRLADGVASRLVAGRVARRPAPSRSPFVVSVGNLSLGGTGKTPVTARLAQELGASGLSGAILTRGYRSARPGPMVVRADDELAGDESRWLVGQVAGTGWPVVQARNRAVGLDFIKGRYPGLDLVILEDGHQTAGVGRHLDILILERWEIEGDGTGSRLRAEAGPVFPLGPWREPVTGARRAGAWLLETEPARLEGVSAEQEICTFERRLILGEWENGGGSGPPTGKWCALSGIARPQLFEASLVAELGTRPELAIRCRDHEHYAPSLVDRITRAAAAADCRQVVTTAKDWVKLQPRWPRSLPILVADLKISWGNGKTLPELVRERLGGCLGSSTGG